MTDLISVKESLSKMILRHHCLPNQWPAMSWVESPAVERVLKQYPVPKTPKVLKTSKVPKPVPCSRYQESTWSQLPKQYLVAGTSTSWRSLKTKQSWVEARGKASALSPRYWPGYQVKSLKSPPKSALFQCVWSVIQYYLIYEPPVLNPQSASKWARRGWDLWRAS